MSNKSVSRGEPLVVYHGSTILFDKIDVNRGRPYKDFGKGFYVTYSKQHAIKMALRNRNIELNKGVKCSAFLYTFDFYEKDLYKFKVKEFRYADKEWINFVLKNRKSSSRDHNFDIVIGPTADDDVLVCIGAYFDGLYGEIGSEIAIDTLIRNIEAENLPGQIFFATNESASLLRLKGNTKQR
jgi:hypothetical protein